MATIGTVGANYPTLAEINSGAATNGAAAVAYLHGFAPSMGAPTPVVLLPPIPNGAPVGYMKIGVGVSATGGGVGYVG